MIFEVEVLRHSGASEGRTYRVDVRPGAEGEVITVDGVAKPIDLVRVGPSWSLLIGSRSHDVIVGDGAEGTTVVRVDGRIVRTVVTAVGRFGAAAHRSRPPSDRGSGPHQVVAPMPGRIVKVLVGQGDLVKARQALVVVEAMKMENELRAPRDGVVSDVRATEGAPVESGAVLMVIE